MRRSLRLAAGSVALVTLFAAVPRVPGASGPDAAGPDAADAPVATPPPASEKEAGEPGATKASRGKSRRELPAEVILCRGPRGAVYARDAAEGCRYARLSPENLVDFGAGSACVLRRASATGGAGESGGSKSSSCSEACAAGKDGRTCVVGLRRGAGGWETFPPTESLPAASDASRDAIAVCCGP